MNGLFGLFLLAQCSLIKHPAGVSVQGWRRGEGMSVGFTVRLARTHLGPPHISHGKTNQTRAEIDGTRFLCTECVNFRVGLLLSIPCTCLGECIFFTGLVQLYFACLPLRSCWTTIGPPSVYVRGGGGGAIVHIFVAGSSGIGTYVIDITMRTPYRYSTLTPYHH